MSFFFFSIEDSQLIYKLKVSNKNDTHLWNDFQMLFKLDYKGGKIWNYFKLISFNHTAITAILRNRSTAAKCIVY